MFCLLQIVLPMYSMMNFCCVCFFIHHDFSYYDKLRLETMLVTVLLEVLISLKVLLLK